jgi:hypothetical protein
LTDAEREDFKNSWDTLILSFEKNIARVTNVIQISSLNINTIVKSIVVFFDRKYSKINLVQKDKNYKYIPLTTDQVRTDIDDYDERMKNVSREMIIPTMKSINYIYIYDFIRECIQEFKGTWYSHYIMNSDKTKILGNLGFKKINADLNVSLKNVYNFCKSLVHETRSVKTPETESDNDPWFSDEYVRLPKTWTGLNDKSRSLVLRRLNDEYQNWFNISRNMFFVMKSSDEELIRDTKVTNEIRENMNLIYNKIRESFTEIIFECMIMKGTLSYIVPENSLTSGYDISIPEQKKKLVNEIAKKRFYNDNPYGENSYYYITNKPFNDTGTYLLNINDVPEEFDYFKICSNVKTAWYLATTFHWIAQIGFCQRFINNRVNYITGGTGAGKSTQVPKLYLYYLKAIDHINDPTVIVTVPRTNVATGVSYFVSLELALPYEELDKTTKRMHRNDNYYVQFKYMKDDHLKFGNFPKLRYITDGSVLQDAKDPLLKNKRIDKNGNYVYSRSDKYHVVIVDEAHEHNTNMDMILTLMKNAVYYNNKLRLVIMSATMNADEPVYRRFYRDINDNRKYPPNQWIKKHKIDRINTERRFHISPPDETTRFKIEEFYRPGADPNEIVQEIIKNSVSGDILLFRPGTKEISESVDILNKPGFLPDDVIALPYHAQLRDFTQNFVKNIDKNLKNLRVSKSVDIDLITEENLTKGNNEYHRAILVATNIAEASISISSLRYVVDTGLEKTMIFDFERRSNILKLNYITDASRLQRRGRVGRVAPGIVYYIYEKNKMINNKKQYGISVQDIHQSVMLDMLRDINDYPIFTDLINILVEGINLNNINLNKRPLNQTIDQDYQDFYKKYNMSDEDIKKRKDFIKSVKDFISDNYMIDEELYDYYGNNIHYDYQNANRPPKIYFSGFDIEQLIDPYGRFYIVHPDELSIERNIGGDIVRTDSFAVISKDIPNDPFRKKMISNKITVFWETLINMGFVGIKNNNLYKTELGILLQRCTSDITSFKDITFTNLLFFGYGLSENDQEFEKILSVVTLFNQINNSMKNLINDNLINLRNPKTIKFEEKRIQNLIKKNYSGNKFIESDADLILRICQQIDQMILDQGENYNIFKSKYFKYDKLEGHNIKGIAEGIPDDLEKSKDGLSKRNRRFNLLLYYYKNDIQNIYSKISGLIESSGIDPRIMLNYSLNKEDLRRDWNDLIYNVDNVNDRKDIDMTSLRKILKNHRNYMKELNIDILKGAIMLTDPYSVFKKIEKTTSSYLSVYNPHIDMIMTVNPNATFVDPPFYQDYIISFSENLEFNTINTLININKSDLMLIGNIYNQREMRRKLSRTDSKKLHLHIDEYLTKTYPKSDQVNEQINETGDKSKVDFRIFTVPEHSIAIMNINSTIEKIKPDIEYVSKSKIWTILEKMGVGYDEYSQILKTISGKN